LKNFKKEGVTFKDIIISQLKELLNKIDMLIKYFTCLFLFILFHSFFIYETTFYAFQSLTHVTIFEKLFFGFLKGFKQAQSFAPEY
jgi:hypothetical protein